MSVHQEPGLNGSADDLLRSYANLQVMTLRHCDVLSRLLVELWPDYFLSRFGARYLSEAFLRRFCDTRGCFGFVWLEEGVPVGYAVGTTDRRRFLRHVLRRAPWRFLRSGAVAACRTPIVLREGMQLLRRLKVEDEVEGSDAELLALGLNPRQCRPVPRPLGGVVSPAHILMMAAACRMADVGAASFRLYCSSRNRLACRFYRELGFRERHRFRMFGIEKICYDRSTDFSDRTL